MNNIYFQGIWRMDWGLGNPNKTAALIALLMLAVWALPLIRRWLFWVALPLFSALGICLMHTISRGGIVALGAGAAVLLWHLRRTCWPWPRGKVFAVTGVMVVMLMGAVYLQTSARIFQSFKLGASENGTVRLADRSITNRLAIWRHTPKMMVDAPWGWGLGNANNAYMSWYQPLESVERYRTLINSHLTWLVEFDSPMRAVYVLDSVDTRLRKR